MQPVYYDILIAAVLLFAAWHGYRRGLVLTVCGFLAIFVGLIGANLLSGALAEPVSQWVEPVIEEKLAAVFEETAQEVMNPVGDAISDQLEEHADDLSAISLTLEEALARLQESEFYANFSTAIENAVESGAIDITANAAKSITHYIAVQLTQAALFLIFFIVIQIAWFILSHALDLAFHLPILSTVNRWTGLALGLLQGAVVVLILCWILKDRFLTPDVIESTYLLQPFCEFRPLLFFSNLSFTTSS